MRALLGETAGTAALLRAGQACAWTGGVCSLSPNFLVTTKEGCEPLNRLGVSGVPKVGPASAGLGGTQNRAFPPVLWSEGPPRVDAEPGSPNRGVLAPLPYGR